MVSMILFDDGMSRFCLSQRAGGDREELSEREARWVLERWLSREPEGGQLRRYAAGELRVDARTDDALIGRVLAVLSARGLTLVPVERTSGETRQSLSQATGPVDIVDISTFRGETRDEQPTAIEIQVLYEDGRPYSGSDIAIDIPGQNRRNETLDDEGRVRLDDVPGPCTCVVTFPKALPMPDSQTEPLSPPTPNGSVSTISRRNPGLVRMVAGRSHRIVIRRAHVRLLQMEDLHFQVGRAILLADGEHSGEDEERGVIGSITALSVAAAVLKYAKDYPDQRLLVAGHTDTTGSETFNADLSLARATNVRLYLTGDADGWAAHCADNAAAEDAQRALRWASRHFGWPCDPGPLDNAFGKRSKSALRAFRSRFSAHTGQPAGQGDTPTIDDYKAMFFLYDDVLSGLLGEGEDPVAWRQGLNFVEPAVLACGEAWPKDAVGIDNYPSAQNRRVDLLFFDEDEIPPDLGDIDSPGKSIYGDPLYVLELIAVDPHDRPDRRVCFELALPLDDPSLEPAGAALRLAADGYDLRVALCDSVDLGNGLRSFRFPGVHDRASYSLTFEADGHDPVPLFEDLCLDAFLQRIDEPDSAVEPLPIARLPCHELDDGATNAVDHGPMHPEMSLGDLGRPSYGGGIS